MEECYINYTKLLNFISYGKYDIVKDKEGC